MSASRGAPQIKVRQMTQDDIPELLEIDRRMVGEQRVLTYADPVDSYIGGNLASSWVAEARGKVVGFVLCRVVEPSLGTVAGAWIELIGVDPDYQGQGVGRRLLEQVVNYCRPRKVERVAVIVDRHDEVMQNFFTRLGFRLGDAVNYTLRLEPD